MGRSPRATKVDLRSAGLGLRCIVCDHDEFETRQAQLNTSVATFFGFDWANPSATCYICDRCRYIHWFLPQK